MSRACESGCRKLCPPLRAVRGRAPRRKNGAFYSRETSQNTEKHPKRRHEVLGSPVGSRRGESTMLAQSSAARQPHMQSGAAGLTAAAVSMPAALCCCILHARYACNRAHPSSANVYRACYTSLLCHVGAVAQWSVAQRRLTVTPVNSFRRWFTPQFSRHRRNV